MENRKINTEKLRREFIMSLIKTREQSGYSQTTLAKACNICQPVIARIESGRSCPTINTLIRILAPMNKTIKVVDMKPR